MYHADKIYPMNVITTPVPPLLGDRRIHLHLGAHKTATTFLQNTLRINNSLLLEQGVFYVPLNRMRADGNKLTNSINSLIKASRPHSRLPEFRREIASVFDKKIMEGCHTVLISDENMSAPLTAFLNGTAYVGMSNRYKFIREELGADLHVFFSVRDYPDFLSSIYVEILRHKPYLTFGDFITKLYDDLPRLWSKAYLELSGFFGQENVTFWDFRETAANPAGVLSMLTAGVSGMNIDPTPSRPGLSQKAVEFIRDLHKLPGAPLPPDLIAKVAERLHPPTKLNGKFDPWIPREKAVLRAHYFEEMKQISCQTFVS